MILFCFHIYIFRCSLQSHRAFRGIMKIAYRLHIFNSVFGHIIIPICHQLQRRLEGIMLWTCPPVLPFKPRGARGGGGWCVAGAGAREGCNLGVIVVRVCEPEFWNLPPFIYLAFEKIDPFIYLIVQNVDLFIYSPLIFFIPIYC